MYKREIRPTKNRVLALKYLHEAGRPVVLDDILPVTGFCDVRVLLLSLAECALYGLCEVTGEGCIITDAGITFYQVNYPNFKHRLSIRESIEREG